MGSINDLRKKLNALDIDKVSADAITQTDSIAADIQVDQQLSGKDANSNTMPDYSYVSVENYGKQPGPIKLRDTGDFHQGIYIKVKGDAITFSSTDDKTKMLEDRYKKKGFDILGLNTESKVEYLKDLQPVFVDKVKKQTGL